MINIKMKNAPTLQGLIDENMVATIAPAYPINKPNVSTLKLTPEREQEILEAAQFIAQREAQAHGNRYAKKDLINDSTLAEARKVVTAFIQEAQKLYDIDIAKVNEEQGRIGKLHKDINGLLHSKKIKAAINDLKKATQPIRDRLNEIEGGVYLGDSYEADVTTFFGMEAVKRLHREE